MPAPDVDILALTSDEQLLAALREAVHGEHRVHCASDPAGAAALAAGHLVGVFVTDVALELLAEVIAPLELRAPGLVTIVAGDRDHGSELLELNNSGPIFRFLLKPVPTGQLRLYVEAAVKHHLELIARGPQPLCLNAPEPAPPARRARWVAGAAVAGVVATLGAWLLTSRPQDVALGTHEPAVSQTVNTDEIRSLLARARQAEGDERLVEPPADNALDLYCAVLALDPNQLVASQKLTEIAERMFERADLALANGRLDVARQAIASAKRALPGHPRLAYFNTRLEVEEQRTMISQAFQAARSGDMGEAAVLIEEAAQVRLGESGAVTEARAELARREDAQDQVDAYLLLAQTRVSEGRLVEPVDDNALFYVQAARGAGGRAGQVAPVVDALVAAVVAQSATALQSDRFDVAEAWLAQARALAPESVDIATAESEIAAARERSERRARWYDLAIERIDRGQLIEPDDDSAAHYLTMLRADAPDHAGLQPALVRLVRALVDAAQGALAEHRLDAAGRQLDAARTLRIASPDLVRAQAAYAAATASAAQGAAPQQTASTRTNPVRRKYVAPKYPLPAERRQIEGRVELELTVDAAGKVKNVTVTDAQPRDTFERAAVAAAEQWEYQPAEVDGAPVEARTLVAIDFSLD